MTPRGGHTFASNSAPPHPCSFSNPSFFSAFLSYLISIRMTFSQENRNYNHGTLCSVALHPLISSIDSYVQSPPSVPVRSRSPPPPRAGAHPPRSSTPQPYVFSDDADVRQRSSYIYTHSSVSSSQSLPRSSSSTSKSRKQQATQRPIRRYSSWRTFHSCSACLAL